MDNLDTPQNIKELLKKENMAVLKQLGQNFITQSWVVDKLLEAAQITPNDTILEIGPGMGILTEPMAKTAKKVIAIEKDKKIAQMLKERLAFDNLEIIHADALKIKKQDLPEFDKIVANIPFYITAPLIRKFLEQDWNKPLFLLVQKEVGQRIVSEPPNLNILALSVQFYAQAQFVCVVDKDCFWPRPRVDAAIIKIEPRPINKEIEKQFFKVVKAGFSSPRKQLLNNLSAGLKLPKEKILAVLEKTGISPQQRAETLSLEQWISLTINFH